MDARERLLSELVSDSVHDGATTRDWPSKKLIASGLGAATGDDKRRTPNMVLILTFCRTRG
eukprot:337190-Amorphochlora_amoeboformis.AAC.1